MGKPQFFLIHGSWHWGGCFQKVADILGASGYAVTTPDLLSHGYSAANWDAATSMDDYTRPVKDLLAKAEEPVILVGHSMGGVTLTHLAETMPEKIRSMVYLSGFMTPVGKTANDYIFSYADNPVAASLFAVLKPVGDWAGLELDMEKPEQVKDAFYGDCSERDVQVAFKNAVTINTSVPNVYATNHISNLPRHYITCALDHAIPLDVQHRMIDEVPGASVHALETSHSPFFSAPKELAGLLIKIAAS